jgi:hypothetical protein
VSLLPLYRFAYLGGVAGVIDDVSHGNSHVGASFDYSQGTLKQWIRRFES